MRLAYLQIVLLMFLSQSVAAQESVFTAFRSDQKKADILFQDHAYWEALDLYQQIFNKGKDNPEVLSKIAICYFQLNEMELAVDWFQRFSEQGGNFTADETKYFASALQATGNYESAIVWMKKYQSLDKNNTEIGRIIWQLQNINYLYEDSAYYHLQYLPINTENDANSPVKYDSTIIFLSNRKLFTAVDRQDATSKKPYYNWYVSHVARDSSEQLSFGKTKIFAPEIKARYHKGSLSFNENGDLMVFSMTSDKSTGDKISSKIYFAKKRNNNQWYITEAFNYNSDSYSVLHPSFANGGNKLYFSSDMPGGNGGTDIYFSDFINGSWTKPTNMGVEINTSQNEGHPFLYDDILYFSSNGHPGLGGLDILHVNLSSKPMEVINPGYPMNTRYDDFNLVLNASGQTGFMVSNRAYHSQKCDNIYQIQIGRRTFPLSVEGKISYKKSALRESDSELILLANAQILLIEKETQKVILEAYTDDVGNFKLEIPSDSQYVLKVTQAEFGTAIVSMEIPRNYQNAIKHDIVIVEDLFNNKSIRN